MIGGSYERTDSDWASKEEVRQVSKIDVNAVSKVYQQYMRMTGRDKQTYAGLGIFCPERVLVA